MFMHEHLNACVNVIDTRVEFQVKRKRKRAKESERKREGIFEREKERGEIE